MAEATTKAPTKKPAGRPKKRRAKRSVPKGQVHIQASFNNTIITVTDNKGNTLTSASAGSSGFRGTKKSTAYAAQIASEKATTEAANQFGLKSAEVFVKGIGLGRDTAIRALHNADIHVTAIRDITGVPHGGVRPRKPRRG